MKYKSKVKHYRLLADGERMITEAIAMSWMSRI